MTAAETYSQVQQRFIGLCESMTEEEANRLVPTCPDWRARDVLAHLVGLCAGIDAGLRKGLGSDDSTAAQVLDRADHSVADMLDEWGALSESMRKAFTEEEHLGWALVADLVTHDLDVRMSLGLDDHRSGPAVTKAAERYAAALVERTEESDLPTVNVIVDGVSCGAVDAPVSLSGSAFEILRAATGRRSAAQVASLDWSADSRPYLPLISPYGPISAVDIAE